jgi:thioesterase domain-containing protein
MIAEAVNEMGHTQPVWHELGYDPHVVIQKSSAGEPPLFCVPGAGDNGTMFAALSAELGRDSTVYALQPRGLNGILNPYTSVEAAAANCVRCLTEIYPVGPMHLLGHSFGGWIAFDIARQLLNRNRTVESLTLIDCEAPHVDDRILEFTDIEVLKRLIEALELSAGRPLGVSSKELDTAEESSRLRILHRGIVRSGLMSSRSSPQALAGPLSAFAAALRTHYCPPASYPHPIRLAVAFDPRHDKLTNETIFSDMLAGWKRCAPQTTVWRGPGNHFTILIPPHVGNLAHWWRSGPGQ